MVLLGVVDDRALEVLGEDVAHDAHGEVGLLEDQRGRLGLLDALAQHLVELEEVEQLALEVGPLGAVGRRADDRAAAAEVELLGLLAQAVALVVVEAARDADALAGGRVDHVAPGDRQLHRQPRALGLQRVLDDLDDDLLPGREQVGDAGARRACRGRGGRSRPRGARSRRRAGSRSSPARCRRRRPRGRAGRCRRAPCRCCRRSSGRRGARSRPRRRGSRRQLPAAAPLSGGGAAALVGCGPGRDRPRPRAWRRGSPHGRP